MQRHESINARYAMKHKRVGEVIARLLIEAEDRGSRQIQTEPGARTRRSEHDDVLRVEEDDSEYGNDRARRDLPSSKPPREHSENGNQPDDLED